MPEKSPNSLGGQKCSVTAAKTAKNIIFLRHNMTAGFFLDLDRSSLGRTGWPARAYMVEWPVTSTKSRFAPFN